jgi:hypothetical protein
MRTLVSGARESGRMTAFKELITRLQTADLRNDAEFHAVLVESQNLLELSDLQIADGLLVSRPTVNRWIRRRNLPHVGMRKSILSWFVVESGRRVRILESARGFDSRYASVAGQAANLNVKQHG